MIHIMIGISGSGKSTRARQLFLQYGGSDFCSIINRDKIREMLYGHTENSINDYYSEPNLSAMEQNVTKYEDNLIRDTLLQSKTTIVDATHLRLKYINRFAKFGSPIVYEAIDTPLEVCIERDLRRVRQVGSSVIKKQYQDLERLKKDFDFEPYIPKVVEQPLSNHLLPDAYVFDVDGTLALHQGRRNPFDWSKVGQDAYNIPIVRLLKDLEEEACIVVCSGRDAVCRKETVDWLNFGDIYPDALFMRKENDSRPDYIIKEELWAEIQKDYNIVAMVDDRQQVVDHARRLGFTVLQCNYGDF